MSERPASPAREPQNRRAKQKRAPIARSSCRGSCCVLYQPAAGLYTVGAGQRRLLLLSPGLPALPWLYLPLSSTHPTLTRTHTPHTTTTQLLRPLCRRLRRRTLVVRRHCRLGRCVFCLSSFFFSLVCVRLQASPAQRGAISTTLSLSSSSAPFLLAPHPHPPTPTPTHTPAGTWDCGTCSYFTWDNALGASGFFFLRLFFVGALAGWAPHWRGGASLERGSHHTLTTHGAHPPAPLLRPLRTRRRLQRQVKGLCAVAGDALPFPRRSPSFAFHLERIADTKTNKRTPLLFPKQPRDHGKGRDGSGERGQRPPRSAPPSPLPRKTISLVPSTLPSLPHPLSLLSLRLPFA